MLNIELLAPLGFWILGYLLSRVLRRNDVADVLWAPAIASVGILAAWSWPSISLRGWLILGMVCVWALRLAIHLLFRGFLGRFAHGEDRRYRAWRQSWGRAEPWRAWFQVFGLQSVLMLVVALPLPVVVRSAPSPLGVWDFVGVGLFLLGFLIETVADAQLYKFKSSRGSHAATVLNTGLWAHSRHPNYFGEILVWWGIGSLVIAADDGYWALMSPVVMTWLMARVSGVPLLEKHMSQSKGSAYASYLKQTPALVPIRREALGSGVVMAVGLVVLDAVWLNGIMGPFYRAEGAAVLRMTAEGWDPLLWPAVGVYVLLALGLWLWAVRNHWADSLWHGALLGFCTYGVYDFTNLSLVRDWSIRMALVDWIWGTALCGIVACLGGWVAARLKPSARKSG